MKTYKYKLFAILLCFMVISVLFPVSGYAQTPVDIGRECSFELSFVPDETKASGVKFEAYKIASVTKSYEFKTEEEFAKQDITKLLENPNEENYNIISSTLSGYIASDSKITPDYTAVSNSSGIARFEKMNVGLYLITGEVYKGENAYYTPQNFMISFPELSDNGLWNYDIFAEVKWEKRQQSEPLNLEILKIWKDSATNLHEKDNVTVELFRNGKLYDTQILGINNNWNYKWNNLSGGFTYTVKEKEIKGYTGTVERNGDCFVITNTPKKPTKVPHIIPQTGVLWLPVPIFTTIGILFILIGTLRKRNGDK